MSPVPPVVAPPLARIAAIQARFSPARVSPPAAPATTSEFAAVLERFGDVAAEAGESTLEARGDRQPALEDRFRALGHVGAFAGVGAGAGPGERGAEAVELSKEYLGIPYLWGGTDPNRGLDCSGFLQHMFRRLGVELPRVSRDQARAGQPVASLEQARPGDLIAFGHPVDHIGMYVGDGQMVHAPRSGDVVKIGPIRREITAIRRVLPEDAPAAVAGVGALPQSGPTPLDLRGLSPAAATYAHLFQEAGARHGIPPRLLASVAQAESNFNPTARSHAGAIGLMQFMPATARGMGIDPLDPAQAVDGAARYLSTQLRDFGSIELALAAYNAGPGNVRRHGGIPPFNETRNYVRKVMSLAGGSV